MLKVSGTFLRLFILFGNVFLCDLHRTLTLYYMTTPIFSTVDIPAVWGNEVSRKTINIKLTAELIQADNFDSELTMDGGNIIGWNADKADIKKYENK